MQDTLNFLQESKNRVEIFLSNLLPEHDATLPGSALHNAMRYGVLNGGKRIRAAFIYDIGLGLEVPIEKLDVPAAAVEMIHGFSLIHDDLPGIDNSDLRRGRLTCHKEFNEATAILAGDALIFKAFNLLEDNNLFTAEQQSMMVKILAKYSGDEGIALGEMIDIEMEHKSGDLNILQKIHYLKTACLFEASVLLGSIGSPHYSSEIHKQLSDFGKYVGITFQIKDDLLDVESTTEVLGKTANADALQEKLTYPSLLGVEKTHEQLEINYQKALTALNNIPFKFTHLKKLVDLVIDRKS